MRLCTDCGADISGRANNAVRCEPCYKLYRQDYFRDWKRVRAPERKCRNCGETIPRDKPTNTQRCRACSEAAIRDRQRLAAAGFPARTRAKPPPPLADHDMTPARVIEVEGEQFEVVFGGGAGLSSVGARGSTLVDSRGAVRRNGNIVMGGL